MKFPLLCALVLASCTKPNPAVCCLDDADCSEVGLDEVRSCSAGLACVDHQCEVPSCSMTGCMSSAPVCNITTDTCDACSESRQCARFDGQNVCDPNSGACVGCVTNADCPAASPVCDDSTCRACAVDSECPSMACGEDGACLDEAMILYLSPSGTDAGECDRATPCRTLKYAVSHTSPTRNQIVMAMGGYTEAGVVVDSTTTAASSLTIHGGGAAIAYPTTGGEAAIIQSFIPITIRDLEFSILDGPSAPAIDIRSASLIERVKIHDAYEGMLVRNAVTLRDVVLEDCQHGLFLAFGGTLTLERGIISGGFVAIESDESSPVQISNTLIWGTTQRAIDLPLAGGTISFSTIVDSGTDSGTGARAISCSDEMTFRSSIVWAPGISPRVPIDGCNIVSSIAGPTPAPGAANTDPQFANAAQHDYHIGSTSPARDFVDTGPATDFEGDPRPRGVRFDIGADEAQ